MGFLDIFRTDPIGEHVRLTLHFVKPAYDAARRETEDRRLHWWDRDDGTVDVVGDGSIAVADRILAAAQAVIPAERARIDREREAGRISDAVHLGLTKRLDALAAETAAD